MSALDLLSALVLEDGRRWGEAAESWQLDDARAILEPGDDGARLHYLTRPRGGSKTGDLAGIAIAALLEQLPKRSRSYAAAADRDQAQLLVDAVAGFVARTPEIGGALRVDSYRVSAERSGASLEALASDEASSWGLKPKLMVVDEFGQWKSTSGPRRFWRALFSALVKDPASRLVVMTSAGDPAHWSHEILELARAGSPRWRVSEVAGPVPWLSAVDVEEQRRMLPPWEFDRLILNRWATSDDRPFTLADVTLCLRSAVVLPPAGHRCVLTLDLGWRHDRTVIAVSHRESGADGRMVVDLLERLSGSRRREVDLSGVEGRVLELARRYGATVRVDPAQAVGMMQRLRRAGVSVVEHTFSQASNTRLALKLHELVREHRLSMPEQPEAVEEFLNVQLRELGPGVYRLDHDASGHDDQVVVIGMAAVHLDEARGSIESYMEQLLAERSGGRAPVGGVPHPLDPRWSGGRPNLSGRPSISTETARSLGFAIGDGEDGARRAAERYGWDYREPG